MATAKQKAKRATPTRKSTSTSRLKRPRQTMPAFVREALRKRGLVAAYQARPAYQRNDWLAWIKRAKQETTQQKRLREMLDELEAGHGYMGMKWHPSERG